MVYDGRPSTGCQTCRRRRIKCDEARPICNQCSRSRRECLGYVHRHDLFFRDETSVTERRAKRTKDRQKQSPNSENIGLDFENGAANYALTPTRSSSTASSSPGTSICPSLTEPLADLAVNFFFANLIFSPRHPGVSRGLFDFLPELYAQSSETSALSYATKATALAAFGSVAGHKDRLSPLAWRTYGNALSELNAALTDPFLARRNETLMTVLLFCMAESLLITKHNDDKHPPISHIDGAVSLLKLRGTELLESEMSARLFLAVRTHMMIERMQQGKALDEYFYSPITGWQHQVAPALQNPANRLTQYTLLVPALRSRATSLLQQSKTQWNIYAISMLLHEVRSIDIILSTWPASIPHSWQFTAISRVSWDSRTPLRTDYDHEIYPGALDSYYDIWIASVWNSYRVSRLFLNAIIVRCVTWLANVPQNPADEDPECINATITIQAMADDICASVPFFLGYQRGSLPPQLEVETLIDSLECAFTALRPTQPSSICGYFLLWPLFVCRSALTIKLSQRKFLRGRMVAIAERFGIAQARMLVEVGDRDEKRPLYSEKWDAGVFERTWEHANLYASSGI